MKQSSPQTDAHLEYGFIRGARVGKGHVLEADSARQCLGGQPSCRFGVGRSVQVTQHFGDDSRGALELSSGVKELLEQPEPFRMTSILSQDGLNCE